MMYRILILDDSPMVRILIEAYLLDLRMPEFAIHAFENGIDTVEGVCSAEYKKVKGEGIKHFIRKPINAQGFKHTIARALKPDVIRYAAL